MKYKVVVEEISHLLYKLFAKLHVKLEKQVHAHTVIAHSIWWLMSPAWAGKNCRDKIYENGGKVWERERERSCLSFYQHLSLTHLPHPPAYTLSTTNCCLSGSSLSVSSMPAPATTTIISTHLVLLYFCCLCHFYPLSLFLIHWLTLMNFPQLHRTWHKKEVCKKVFKAKTVQLWYYFYNICDYSRVSYFILHHILSRVLNVL